MSLFAVVGLMLTLSSVTLQAPPMTTNAVVVTAKPKANTTLTARIDDFVSNPDTPELLRWKDGICPVVSGLAKSQDKFIEHRLRDLAISVGAPVDSPNCEVNLIVIISPDAQKVLKELRRYGDGVLGAGATRLAHVAELQRFLADDNSPVHDFSMWQESGSSQSPIQIDGWGHRTNPSDLTATSTLHAYDSRIIPNSDIYFSRRVIVIDQSKFHHVNLQQMSGYVALVSLAQVNTKPKIGEKTVLELSQSDSDSPADVEGLADWDIAYLTALYKLQSSKSLSLQKAMLADVVRSRYGRGNDTPSRLSGN